MSIISIYMRIPKETVREGVSPKPCNGSAGHGAFSTSRTENKRREEIWEYLIGNRLEFPSKHGSHKKRRRHLE